jgi:nucleotide-binding universal stress UspA family protein
VAGRPKNVLLCFDGSELSRRALDAAAALIGYGSTLAVANVAPGGEQAADAVLRDAREALLHRGLTATYVALVGDPAEKLLEAARGLDVDLLVVGRRNHADAGEPKLGRVSGDVVRKAPCDVLVVT